MTSPVVLGNLVALQAMGKHAIQQPKGQAMDYRDEEENIKYLLRNLTLNDSKESDLDARILQLCNIGGASHLELSI